MMNEQKFDAFPPVLHRFGFVGGQERYGESLCKGRDAHLADILATTRQAIARYRMTVSLPLNNPTLGRLTKHMSDYRHRAVAP